MFRQKPTFWLIFFVLASLLLLAPLRADEDGATVPDAGSDSDSDSDSESEGIEELLALDDEAENEKRSEETSQRSSEADVLTKAQRIVLELNDDNTKRVIEANEFVLVLGYAPWCPRSAELMPRFAEAANSLNALNSPLLMAKLDAERHPKAALALEIKGFPTLALFVNGSSQLYNGGFFAEDIVIWAMKKTGMPVVRINTVPEAEEFLKKHHIYVIGYFGNLEGTEHDEFTKAASADTEIQFVETSNVEVAGVIFPEFKPFNDKFVGIVKSEPERYTVYEGASFEKETLLQFVNFNKFALVTKLTEMNSPSVYSSPVKLQVMVFAQEADFDKLLEPIRDVARKFKSKILFMYIDITDENLAKPFLTLYGLEDSKNTVVAAFDNSMSSKFLLESDPTRDNIEDFCSKLLQGKQDQFFKSQPTPDNTDASINVVVGRTFEDLVIRSPKNVLLEVFTPWCLACDKTSKQVEKLAKHFKGSDLVFARFDAAVNEHPKLHVDDYPTLLLYRTGEKETPVKLSTKASLKDLAGSINKHLKAREKVIKDEL